MKAHPWYLERLYHERSASIETMTHCDVVDNKDLEIGARMASLMINDPKLASGVKSRFATINNISDISLWYRGRVVSCLEYKTTKGNIWSEHSALPIVNNFINQKPDYLHKYNRMCEIDWTLYVITDSRGDEIFSSNQHAESMKALWGRQVAFEMRRPHHKVLYDKTTMGEMCSTILPEFMTQMQRYMMQHAPAQNPHAWQLVGDEISHAADQDVPEYTLDQQITVNETQMSLKFAGAAPRSTQVSNVVETQVDQELEEEGLELKEQEEEMVEEEEQEESVSSASKRRRIGVDDIVRLVTERLKDVATESDPHGFMSLLSRVDGAAEMYDVFKCFSDADAVIAFYDLAGYRVTERYQDCTRQLATRLMGQPVVRVIASITIAATSLVRQNALQHFWRRDIFRDMICTDGSGETNAMYRIIQSMLLGATRSEDKDPDVIQMTQSRSIEHVVEVATKILETIGEEAVLHRFDEDVRMLYRDLCDIDGAALAKRSKICAMCNIQPKAVRSKTADVCLNSRVTLLALAVFLAKSNRDRSSRDIAFELSEFNVQRASSVERGSDHKFNTMAAIVRALVKR
jgi:hypothetical protein